MQIVDEVESDLVSVIKNDWPNLPSGKSARELLPNWMAYKARSIVNIPRKVIVSHRVQALRTQFQEISTIENLFTNGGDLKPYLSKVIYSQAQKPDADRLFLDWGIHHLHLGLPNGTASVDRTGPVLFVRVDGGNAYLLDVKDHGSGHALVWVDEDLIRALGEVDPEGLKQFELKGISGFSNNPNAAERMKLRGKDINVGIEVDGKFYMGPGMGMTTASTGVRFQRLADRVFIESKKLVATQNEMSEGQILGVRFESGRLEFYEKSTGTVLLHGPILC